MDLQPLVKLLLLLIFCGGGFVVLREWLRRARYQRLRDNPPERACIEVRLPRGIPDANKRMERFYRTVLSLVEANDAAVRKGERSLQLIYHASVPKGRTQPELRFYVCCDPAAMDQVKRQLKQRFDELAEIIPAEDPSAALAARVRAQEDAARRPPAGPSADGR